MITYPLNNIDYTAEDAELYFSTRESGVYDGNDFEVTVSGIDNDVIVGSGIAWIHNTKFSGKVVGLKEPKTLTLSLPNSVYDRIDAIVVQFDANKNATEIIVKEGIASSSPVAPSVVRTESLYELHIFHAQRKAGATVISIDDLVDLRNDSDYCGIMFDPISSVDPTFTKKGYAADAAETGKQIKRATNVRNLLDNSDFTLDNFIAQAGVGGNHGTQPYTGDRWMLYGTATLSENGLTITGYMRQRVIIPDGTYTIGLEKSDGTIQVRMFTKNGNEVTNITDNGSCYAVMGSSGYVEIGIDTGTYAWAVLYEGEYTAETLPPYVPKGYGAELAECQRYFINNVGSMLSGYFESTTVFRYTVTTPVPMRIKPTVTINKDDNVVYYESEKKTASVTSASVHTIRQNGVVVNLTVDGGGSKYISGVAFATNLSFSADL